MQIDGAIVKEQGVTFAIVIVKPHAIQTQSSANDMRQSLSGIADFQGLPMILASQDTHGRFTYQGRHDIVDFLASIDASRIPWKRYTIS
ncbi:hypothetical protein [Synechococcus sp. PCC 6312]|uniref:hypothetical protein n=1 Tax=Synechococcus sp. (strain ATCC 27167 / PCC 6312) TaxID=195253 RepID=UPI00029ED81C|nr:hypothetical protein [Synechococcus sp. PCC 6312]AFY61070.1 hypothetical protein Syn6312_1932 [Synechococcus sp. PCC 6312]